MVTIDKKAKVIIADMRHATPKETKKINKLLLKGYKLEKIDDGTTDVQMMPHNMGIHTPGGGFGGLGGF